MVTNLTGIPMRMMMIVCVISGEDDTAADLETDSENQDETLEIFPMTTHQQE